MNPYGRYPYRKDMQNRDYIIKNPFITQSKKAQPQRAADPKEFSDSYLNPLYNLMPLVSYLSGIPA